LAASIKVDSAAAGKLFVSRLRYVQCSPSGTLSELPARPVGLKHKHDQQECQERGMSYSVPLKVKIRLTVYDKDPDTNVKSIATSREEEVFFGEIPLMD